jgi:hypothetical protein
MITKPLVIMAYKLNNGVQVPALFFKGKHDRSQSNLGYFYRYLIAGYLFTGVPRVNMYQIHI